MSATMPASLGGPPVERALVRTLLHQRTTGVALLDAEGRYLAVNETFAELLGCTPAALQGRSWRSVTHPADLWKGQVVLDAAAGGAYTERQGEKRYLRPDGEIRWALVGTSALQDEDGKTVGFLSLAVDISTRKDAEDELRDERGLLELLTAVTTAVHERSSEEHALRVTVNAICAHTGWPVGHAVRVDGERLRSTGVWVSAETADARRLEDALAERIVDDRGAAPEAAGTAAPVWRPLHESGEPHAARWEAAGVRAVGAWPVVADGTVVGVLELGSDRPEPPHEALANAITSVCTQAGQAIARTRTLERLQSSEEQLREAQQVAGFASWWWDADTGEVSWSDQVFRLLGREPGSVAPALEWFLAHVHEDDQEQLYAQLERLLGSGEPLELECRLVCADGRIRTVHVGAEIASFEDHRPRHVVGYLQDVSAQAEAKAALARSEERVRLILQNSSDAVVEFDDHGAVTEWNQAAEMLFGWTRAEAVGRQIADLLVAPGDAGTHLLAVLTARDTDAFDTPVEAVTRRRDGSVVPVEVTIPRTPGAALRSTFIRDISERKQAEEALQQTNRTLQRSVTALERRSREVATLNEMIDLLQSASDASEAHRIIAGHAAQLFPHTKGVLYVPEHDSEPLVAVACWGGHEPLEPSIVQEDCWALRRARVHQAVPGASSLHCPHARNEHGPTACAPMLVQNTPIGLLHLSVTQPSTEEDHARTLLLHDFAERTGLALANIRLRERLRIESIHDPLTGLYNRRYLEETFERELVRARRNGYPLGVALIDLDRFKQFNDRYGHQVGDAALRNFAQHILGHVRGDDVACRYGGEEFVVLFPNASLEQVRSRCDELREQTADLVLPGQSASWRTTISVGVAASPEHGDDTASILQAADGALYAAKRQGRDRVVTADPVA